MAELECVGEKLIITEDHKLESSNWGLFSASEGRYIVQDRNQQLASKTGLGGCWADMFYRFLVGLVQARASGVVSVLVRDNIKKIYFSDGVICFAGSDLMDDRLAEVLYRSGLITIDQLVKSTVKVTKELKFGKVLLNMGILSKNDLWLALKMQVKHIVSSIFLSDYIYYEWKEGSGLAFTELVFSEDSQNIIESAYGYGRFFKMFCESILNDAIITVDDYQVEFLKLSQGTFIYDFINIIKESSTISNLVSNWKLNEAYTYLTLIECMSKNICGFNYNFDLPEENSRSTEVSRLIKEYEKLISVSKNFFSIEGIDFPIEDIREYWLTLFTEEREKIYPTTELLLSDFTKDKIRIMCFLEERYFNLYRDAFLSVKKFITHISIDALPFTSTKKLKEYIKAM